MKDERFIVQTECIFRLGYIVFTLTIIHILLMTVHNPFTDTKSLLGTPSKHLNSNSPHTDRYNTPASVTVSEHSDWNGILRPVYFVAYSAYYDDRNPKLPRVSVMAVIDYTKEFEIHCELRDQDGQLIEKPRKIFRYFVAQVPRDVTSDGIKVAAAVVSCRIFTQEIIPKFVRLKMMPNDTILCNASVSIPEKPQIKQPLGLCVKNMYIGKQSRCETCKPSNHTLQLVPWFELQQLLGVSSIVMYNRSLTPDASRIVEYYMRKGLVQMHSHRAIGGDDFKHPGSLGINDCMYRTMHVYDKILLLDTDEVVIPRNHSTLTETIQHAALVAGRDIKGSQFLFAHSWFYTDHHKPDTSKKSYLPFFRYRHHDAVSPFPGPCKAIIDPQTCHYSTLHFCYVASNGAQKSRIEVAPSVARLHHYKDCYMPGWWTPRGKTCTELWETAIADDVMMRYEDVVEERVNNVMKELNFLI